MALTDIGKSLDLNKTTVHRLLATLRKRGDINSDWLLFRSAANI
jgi:DNA-binding IclR family transcriptional regulator